MKKDQWPYSRSWSNWKFNVEKVELIFAYILKINPKIEWQKTWNSKEQRREDFLSI